MSVGFALEVLRRRADAVHLSTYPDGSAAVTAERGGITRHASGRNPQQACDRMLELTIDWSPTKATAS